MKTSANIFSSYPSLLRQVKQRVALAQQRAIYAANEELLRMYWDLGQMLHNVKNAEGWGKGTLVRLSKDLKNEYPEEKGFSVRNFQFMIQFFEEYNQELTMVKAIAHPPVAQLEGTSPITKPAVAELQAASQITKPTVSQLPEYNFSLPVRHIHWTHNVILMQRVKDVRARYWYMIQCLTSHWSKDFLAEAKPIGISDYELGQALPCDLRSSLPSIDDIEAEFDNETE